MAPLLALLAQGTVPPPLVGCTVHDPPAERPADATEGVRKSAASATMPTATTELDPVRVKGLRPALVVHRLRDGEVQRLRADATTRDGDVLQISYVAAGNRHGVIVSWDDRGALTLHHPSHADAPAALTPRGETPLPSAYTLDDARGFERFVFVTSGDAPIDVATALRAARTVASGQAADQAPLALPSGWRQTSVTLTKERSAVPSR